MVVGIYKLRVLELLFVEQFLHFLARPIPSVFESTEPSDRYQEQGACGNGRHKGGL
jgi:hypothetical protein